MALRTLINTDQMLPLSAELISPKSALTRYKAVFFFPGRANFVLRNIFCLNFRLSFKMILQKKKKKSTNLKYLTWYHVVQLSSASWNSLCYRNPDTLFILNCGLVTLNKCCGPSVGPLSPGWNDAALHRALKCALRPFHVSRVLRHVLKSITMKQSLVTLMVQGTE